MTQPPPPGRLQDTILRCSSAALGLCAIILLWDGLLYTLESARDTALASAKSESANFARAFAEQIKRATKAVDQSLMFVRENYAQNPEGFDVAAWTRSAAAVTDTAIQLSIIDKNGFVRANSLASDTAPWNLSDREHIRVHLNSTADDLFISKPVIGRVSHRWSIQFTRKLFRADGTFDGVAVVSLDPGYLTRLYRSIDLGQNSAITLVGLDGIVRAADRRHEPGTEDAAIGQLVATTHLHDDDESPEAVVGPVDFDVVRRVTSYQAVDHYPLIVAVGLAEDSILANYRSMRQTNGLVAAVLTVLLLAVTLATLAHQHRHTIARRRLRESQRLFAEKSMLLETALEHMGQGILMVNGDRLVEVCNNRAMTMLDLPPNLLVKGTPFDDVLRYQRSKDEYGAIDGLSGQADDFARAGGISSEPVSYERKRPTGAVLEICSMPLRDGGMVRTYTDISARKAIEEDLRATRDQAHGAAKAKSEFLATMSHEIRSPLSGLVGALDLLCCTELRPDQSHMANLAHGSALTLLAILNDILDFSKIEAGALTLSAEPVELHALIAEITGPHALVAKANAVPMEVHLDPGLPRFIRTDRLRLGQIITNLVANSVKFTQRGFISLTAAVEDTAGRSRLRIDVRDSGIGMDAATLGKLFQPFTQGDGSSSRAAGGTGLGLCISRRLATMLGGTLTVVSEPDVGSCFTLLIDCEVELAAAIPLPSLDAGTVDQALAGQRVLVVDDNPTNLWLTSRQLLMLGAKVETAANGQAALKLLAATHFDVILTDCHMPGMDGVALTAAIRQSSPAWSETPVIGLTADVTSAQAQRCRDTGMDDLLYKPVSRDRLAQVLSRQPQTTRDPVCLALFDTSTFDELFGADDAEGAEWLRSYCSSLSTQLHALRQHLSAKALDRPGLAAAAHRLVGASLSVGTVRLATALRSIENAAADQSERQLRELLAAVDTEAELAVAAIHAFLDRVLPAVAS